MSKSTWVSDDLFGLVGLDRPLNINVTVHTHRYSSMMYQIEIPDVTKVIDDVYGLWCFGNKINPMIFDNAINAGFTKFRIDDSALKWVVPSLFKYEEYITDICVYGAEKYTQQTDIINCDWMLVCGYDVLTMFLMSKEEFYKGSHIGEWESDTWRVCINRDHFQIYCIKNHGHCGVYYLEDSIKLIKERIGII